VRQPLLELNVSSLSDWPIAYRRISFAWNEADKRLLVRGDLMPHGDKPSASYADLLAAWEAEDVLYAHAHAYQDAMLDAILQLATHLGQRAHGLYDATLPGFCGDTDFFDCARTLQATRFVDFAGHVELFRRKATLSDLLGSRLDDLKSAQAAAYMTCRAVQAARIDFELTPESGNNHRGEVNRRAEQFFRVEASVGMD
jgi:hypothetical protein